MAKLKLEFNASMYNINMSSEFSFIERIFEQVQDSCWDVVQSRVNITAGGPQSKHEHSLRLHIHRGDKYW